jgi:hypothetical protein
MTSERYEKGMKKFKEIHGPVAQGHGGKFKSN